jgi:DNA polymerase III subunit epsilon
MTRGFAVVDLETTGILPGFRHRVTEIGIVLLDPEGRIESRWTSVINPVRDMGPQVIHGISAAEARRAPVFADLAGDVLARLEGRVLVAHQVSFELMHLRAEFGRLGLGIEWAAVPHLCTMQLAGRFLRGFGRSLVAASEALGLPPFAAHTAAGDAEATAALFAVFLRANPGLSEDLIDRASELPWPSLPTDIVPAAPRRIPRDVSPHWLTRIVDRLPRTGDPEVDAYLALLDRAVVDRRVDDQEAEELLALAYELGLHRLEAVAAHHAYLRAVARAAWDDGVVTAGERVDLYRLATALGLASDEVDEALSMTDQRADFHASARLRLTSQTVLVFTGKTQTSEPDWTRRLSAIGIKVSKTFNLSSTLVVAADPDTQSGKAEKARRCGVPIIAEGHLEELYTEALAPHS